MNQALYSQKIIFFVTYESALKARVFVPGKPYLLSVLQHSSLLNWFLSCEESEVLWIRTQALKAVTMIVERKIRYSALLTNLVGWHTGAVSLPLSNVILAQLACPPNDVMFCLHSGINIKTSNLNAQCQTRLDRFINMKNLLYFDKWTSLIQ